MPNVPSDLLASRFYDDCLKLLPSDFGRVGLCVSGGPDSVAMLLLAKAAGLDCQAVTIDHGLRPEAADEARLVAAVCTQLGVPHEIRRLNSAPNGNVSAWARAERYKAIDDWADTRGLAWLMTAHHADDQLETLLMRLNRGAGIGGLSGVRSVNGRYIRPLLLWRKAELIALTAASGVQFVEDPSNTDERYDRARMRKALADAPWLDPVSAARSAHALAEAHEALDWVVDQLAATRISVRDGHVTLDPVDLPAELARRLTIRCLHAIAGDCVLRGPDVERLIETLGAGNIATLAGVKCNGGQCWTFSRAPDHKNGGTA